MDPRPAPTKPPFSQPLYRFVDEIKYAEGITRGAVRLSTLRTCRELTDPYRLDELDGKHIYRSGVVVGGSGDPEMELVAKRMSFAYGPGNTATVFEGDNEAEETVDGFVLCFSRVEYPDPAAQFAPYGVHVLDVPRFCAKVVAGLAADIGAGPGMVKARLGSVRYRDPVTVGAAPRDAVPTEFIKRPGYAYENEARLTLCVVGAHVSWYTPRVVQCGPLHGLARLMPPQDQLARALHHEPP